MRQHFTLARAKDKDVVSVQYHSAWKQRPVCVRIESNAAVSPESCQGCGSHQEEDGRDAKSQEQEKKEELFTKPSVPSFILEKWEEQWGTGHTETQQDIQELNVISASHLTNWSKPSSAQLGSKKECCVGSYFNMLIWFPNEPYFSERSVWKQVKFCVFWRLCKKKSQYKDYSSV